MNAINAHRITGWSAILSAILYLISIMGLMHYVASDLNDMEAFAENMIREHFWMLLYGWPGILATLLIFPIVYVLQRESEKHLFLVRVAALVSFIGLAFILVGYLFHLAFTYFHIPMYVDLDEINQDIFATVIRSTIGLQDMFWLSGDLFAFGGIALLLTLRTWTESYVRWLSILGITSGVMAAVGSFSFLPAFKNGPVLAFLFLFGFVAFAIWEIALGVSFLQTQKNS